MRHSRARLRILAVVLVARRRCCPGCGAKRAYRQGQGEAKKGNWDLAVARLTKALRRGPRQHRLQDRPRERPRSRRAAFHYDGGEEAPGGGRPGRRRPRSWRSPPSTTPATSPSPTTCRSCARASEARGREAAGSADFEAMKEPRPRPRASRCPILSPRSTAPINMNFPEQGLEKIFDALAKVSGVNILFDPDFRDKKVSVHLTGVTFQEALDQITFANRLFYKVLDRNTIIIVPESRPSGACTTTSSCAPSTSRTPSSRRWRRS